MYTKVENPLFNIISSNIEPFKNDYQIELKQSTQSVNYLLVTLNQPKVQEILVQEKVYQVNEAHISVYADVRRERIKDETSHHLTLTLERDKKKFIAHTYFNKANKFCFATLKDSEEVSISIEVNKTSFLQSSYSYVTDFFNIISGISEKIDTENRAQHQELLKELIAKETVWKDTQVADTREKAWEDYNQHLIKLINHLKAWENSTIQPDLHAIRYFTHLKKRLDKQPSQLFRVEKSSNFEEQEGEDIATPALQASELSMAETSAQKTLLRNKRLAEIKILLEDLKKIGGITKWNKILKEHALLIEKLDLLESDNELLSCILRIRVLEETAHETLCTILSSRKDYAKISKKELEELIKLVPTIQSKALFIAVQEDRAQAIDLMFLHHNYLNSNITNHTKNSLFMLASTDQSSKSFTCLLKINAFCDGFTAEKNSRTLLMQACNKLNETNIQALLEAGASPFIKSDEGYNAFGYLTMRDDRIPPLNLVKLFLARLFPNKDADSLVNSLQGALNQQGTAFTFACQKGWLNLASLYLECGANPTIARETDLNCSMTICAAKGHLEIFAVILEKSKFELERKYLVKPYLAAKNCQQAKIIQLIEEYARKRGFCITEAKNTEQVTHFGAGTSQEILRSMASGSHPVYNLIKEKIVSQLINITPNKDWKSNQSAQKCWLELTSEEEAKAILQHFKTAYPDIGMSLMYKKDVLPKVPVLLLDNFEYPKLCSVPIFISQPQDEQQKQVSTGIGVTE